MKKMVIASLKTGSGKTSITIGLAKALGKSFGYMKPFGDRLIYRGKRLWDYDSSLMTDIFGLKEDPVDISIGFDHSKLLFMYDEEGMKRKLREMADHIGKGNELLFIEGGKAIDYGISVHLDPVSLARTVDGELIFVITGDKGAIIDDLVYIRESIDLSGIQFKGVIINKVKDLNDFKKSYINYLDNPGIPVIGIIPHRDELMRLSISYIADRLLAKVIAGEKGMRRSVKNILVGAMSTDAVLRTTLFQKEDKLIITAGDRSDMILTALENDASAIILTNNILPPANIISKASELNTPLLLVPYDTFQAAKKVDDMDPLLVKDETEKIYLLETLVKEYVNIEKLTP